MKSWLRLFGITFYIGFLALIGSLAYGLMVSGTLLADLPVLVSMRAFGVAFIAAGLTMWIMLRREEAGAGSINPLLGFLSVAGGLLALAALTFPAAALSPSLRLGGMAAALAGLVIGLIVDIFNPAFPKPIAKKWPEDATAVLTRFAREDDSHGYGH